MMKRWIAVLALTACGRGGGSSAQTKLHVKHGGAEVPMVSAVAAHAGDGSIHVWTANHEIPCSALLQGMRRNVPHDDVEISVTAAKRLAPDGTLSWELTHYDSALSPELGELGPMTVAGDETAAEGKTVELTFAYKDVSGTIVATGCGDMPLDPQGVPKAKHPSTATITVAGKKLPIASAWRYQGTTYVLTGPSTCAYDGLPTPIRLGLTDGNSGGNWALFGGWFVPAAHTAWGDDTKLTITEGAKGDGPDGPTVQLVLGGSATIEGFAVELSGTVEALACVKR